MLNAPRLPGAPPYTSPITWPFMLKIGPPELPWLAAVSYWMASVCSANPKSEYRPTPLTSPNDTLGVKSVARSWALPMMSVQSPARSSELSPSSATGNFSPASWGRA